MEWHDYIDSVKDQISNKKARLLVEDELYDHFDEQTKAYEQDGMDHESAANKAMEDLGDSVEIGTMFDRVHRPKVEKHFIGLIIAISLFAVLLQFFVAKYVITGNDSSHYFRKELVCIVLGLILMVGIYFADYTLIGKYPMILWTLACIFTISQLLFGKKYFNMNENIFFLSYLFLPLYAGVLFYLRKYQLKGLLLSGMLGILPVLFCIFGGCISGAVHYSIVSFIMLCAATKKGWFGNQTKKNVTVLFGGIGVIAIILGVFIRYSWMNSYQIARLNAVLHGKYI